MNGLEEQMSITDNDFKYALQDSGSIYVGARYSYAELLEQEFVPFKLKAIISQYILKEVDAATTLESHFYYMTQEGFAYKTFLELKLKIKVSCPEKKRNIFGKVSYPYKDKIYTLKEFTEINLAQKKKQEFIVREIIFSKLGLMTFTV